MPQPMSKNLMIVTWILRVVVAAAFLFMGALPKLTGDAMAMELFEKLGAEPGGRYAVGALEAITAILLLVPPTGVYGALLGCVLMIGALGTHLFGPLGFPMDPLPNTAEPPPLGVMAIAFLALCGTLAFLLRAQLPLGGKGGAGSPGIDAQTPHPPD